MTTTTLPTLRASTAARLALGEKVRSAILASIEGAKAMLAEAGDRCPAATRALFDTRLAALVSVIGTEDSADWYCLTAEGAVGDAETLCGRLIGASYDYAPLEGAIKPATELQRREMARDRTFRTFAAGDLQHWRLTPPAGHQPPLFALDAPFERGTSPKHGRGVRSVLTGPLLRAYTATWALTGAWAAEHGGVNPHGLFEMRARDVLLDLYGLRPAFTTVRGVRYSRAPTTSEKELAETFGTLHLCLLEGIGNVSASAPESLLTRYRDDNTGRAVYRQAPLAMLALQRYFIQVPREVLRLDPLDTPLALGVARGLLQHARIILRGPGHWRCTLEELARVAGDPIADKRRNRGVRDAYSTLAERLQRVVRGGALGEVHVEGEGPDAVVTLTPSDALGTVYSTLAERPAEPLEAAVAKALTGKRRPGRPRKGPLA